MKLFFLAIFFILHSPSVSAATCQKIVSKDGKNVSLSGFLPHGYLIAEEITGDLNSDTRIDCILLIKGTSKNEIIHDKNRGPLDRNRRGLIVLLNRKNTYEVVVKNESCFSSENEDGGIYFPPDLFLEVKKGNLSVQYGHGRYGHWSYTFRLKDTDMELIGFDRSSNDGPITNTEISINFLTKKKLEKVNLNKNAEAGEEVFKETWKKIELPSPILLSKIKDFNDLDRAYSE
jgi:hypothetical protein